MAILHALFASLLAQSLGAAHALEPEPAGHGGALAARREAGSLPGAKRALPNSPSGGYAPEEVSCPGTRPTVRLASALSDSETAWLKKRRSAIVEPMAGFLDRVGIADFDAGSYVRKGGDNLPVVGLAASGGGYRALMNGAGFLQAADSRTPGSTDEGGIGGLLQSATYLAGLSGGGWLVGSVYANNFSSISKLQAGEKDSPLWQFDRSIFVGPDEGTAVIRTVDYWKTIISDVNDKIDAGFNASLTDFWGRGLSFQLVKAEDGGPQYTFSSIAQQDSFKNAEAPMPFLVADGRSPGTEIVSLNSTVFEFNPYEMGSWDPTTFGFVPTEYIGSDFNNGKVSDHGKCVRGFDQVGYVMGTSSSLFNTFLLNNLTANGVPQFAVSTITDILEKLSQSDNDIAQYQPNPFRGWRSDRNKNADEEQLDLVDGGEDLQNIPFYPLIQPRRKVDVIFAVDSSADTPQNWPNATALRATYDRTKGAISNGTQFPAVPDVNTMYNKGLTTRPTFFGCDAANFSSRADGSVPPLVVYLPNAPYSGLANVSTFTPAYPQQERDRIIRNGYDGATRGNGTLDADWPACVACAVLARSLARTGTDVPRACRDCFDRYCWDGELDTHAPSSTVPAGFLLPDAARTLDQDEDSAAASVCRRPASWAALLVCIGATLGMSLS